MGSCLCVAILFRRERKHLRRHRLIAPVGIPVQASEVPLLHASKAVKRIDRGRITINIYQVRKRLRSAGSGIVECLSIHPLSHIVTPVTCATQKIYRRIKIYSTSSEQFFYNLPHHRLVLGRPCVCHGSVIPVGNVKRQSGSIRDITNHPPWNTVVS